MQKPLLSGVALGAIAVLFTAFAGRPTVAAPPGVFNAPVNFAVPSPTDVSVADVDRDGNLDFVSYSQGNVAIFYGTGPGAFSTDPSFVPIGPAALSQAAQVLTTDLNGDKFTDLIVTAPSTNRVEVRLGQGNRLFVPNTSYLVGNQPSGIFAADFNQDGRPDLAVAHRNSADMAILFNQGDGGFTPPTFYPASAGFGSRITGGDINKDGFTDLVMSYSTPGRIVVWVGQQGGIFQQGASLSVASGAGAVINQVLLRDFTGDGNLDIAVADGPQNGVQLAIGNGAGGFSLGNLQNAGLSPSRMTAADVDRDSALDLLVPNAGTTNFSVLFNNGSGVFGPPQAVPSGGPNTFALTTADLFGGGDSEVIVANETSNRLSVALNFTPRQTPTLDLNETIVDAGGPIQVTFAAPAAPNALDWIGLFRVGTPNTAFLAFQYTNADAFGQRLFAAPTAPGVYEFRYLVNNTPVSLNKSAPFTVTGRSVSAGLWKVNFGEAITADFTAPFGASAAELLGLFPVGSNVSVDTRSTGGARTGTVTFSAPNVSGDYEVRYLLPNFTSVAKSETITVGAPSRTITPSPTSLVAGGQIRADFTAPAGSSPRDWIGLFRVGQSSLQFSQFFYTQGSTGSVFFFTAPPTPGQYELRYFLNDSFTVAARSVPITVRAPRTVTPSTTFASVGQAITCAFTAPVGSPARDWVGLYLVGAPINQFLSFQYTGGAASGNLPFTLPMVPGDYEFRYNLNDGFETAAVSTRITVSRAYSLTVTPLGGAPGITVTGTFTAPANSSALDWIGLFRVGAPNTNPISFQYTNGVTDGQLDFVVPAPAGSFELRFFQNNGYNRVATSQTITTM